MSESFGSLLRQERRRSGLTQEHLAGTTGLSVEGISLLERGIRRQPRPSTVTLLVEALSLSGEAAEAFRVAAAVENTADEADDPDHPTPDSSPVGRVARELPAAPSRLIGRAQELGAARRLVQEERIVALVGLGGVGKSALALTVAHEISDSYADGAVHLDLRGTDRSERLAHLPALRALMASIGEDPDGLPLDVGRAGAAWRSVTSQRRILLVLDDAADLHQIEPLLPSAGSTVLVTARRNIAAGHFDIAQLDVAPLSGQDSRTLLHDLTEHRVRRPSEQPALDQLADRCHGLPLALRMVAARLTSRSHWPADYFVERIDAAGGDLLDFETGTLSLRKTLVTSVEELDASDDPIDREASRTFRALGLIPGGPVSLAVVGSLIDADDREAERIVERLVEVRLLEPGRRPGTYVMHNVMRSVARDLAAQFAGDLTDEVRGRMIGFFNALAWQTRELSRPTPAWIDLAEMTAAVPPGWSRDHCLDEIAAHAEIWQAITRSAAAGSPELRSSVARMSMGLITYFVARADTAGWPDQLTAALEAVGGRDHPEVAWLGQDLALALSGNGEYDRAAETAATALEIAQRLGDVQCMSWAKLTHALALSRGGHPSRARVLLEEVRTLANAVGDARLEAAAWRDMTILNQRVGRLEDAVDTGEKSLRLYQQVGSERGVAMGQINLGTALRDLGRLDLARPLLEDAVASAQAVGDRALTTEALDELGRWHHVYGDCEGAVRLLHKGLDLVDENGGRQWEARIRERLAEALHRLGRDDEATTHWAAAAQVHISRGEWTEAADAATRADPSSPRLRLVPSDAEPAHRSSG